MISRVLSSLTAVVKTLRSPLVVVALVMALVAAGVLGRVLQEAALAAGTTVGELPPLFAASVALGYPAYVVALVVGTGAFVAWR